MPAHAVVRPGRNREPGAAAKTPGKPFAASPPAPTRPPLGVLAPPFPLLWGTGLTSTLSPLWAWEAEIEGWAAAVTVPSRQGGMPPPPPPAPCASAQPFAR